MHLVIFPARSPKTRAQTLFKRNAAVMATVKSTMVPKNWYLKNL